MKTFRLMSLLTLVVLVAVGCASRTSGDIYAREDALRAQHVEQGQVIDVRPVQIEGSASGLGVVAGGILGYAVGGTIGGGSGQDVAQAVGLITGALFGAVAEEGVSRQQGLEITVQLDHGPVIAVVQQTDADLSVGDRVRVLTGPDGLMRISPARYQPMSSL